MKKKMHELLSFPCSFPYKVIGIAKPELTDQIVAVVQQHIPGDYVTSVQSSRKGRFQSVSITITATNITQIETLYEDLSKIELVRIVL